MKYLKLYKTFEDLEDIIIEDTPCVISCKECDFSTEGSVMFLPYDECGQYIESFQNYFPLSIAITELNGTLDGKATTKTVDELLDLINN